MSLLEVIFDQSKGGAEPVSLPEVLTVSALGSLAKTVFEASNPADNRIFRDFCKALLDNDTAASRDYVDMLIESGAQRRHVLHGYIGRTAALIGEAWAEDYLTFTEVTIASGRLMEIARELANSGPAPRPTQPSRKILLARAPGEEHALGAILAADMLRHGGWAVQLDLQGDRRHLLDAVRSKAFDAIGLSCGSRRLVPMLKELVPALRLASGRTAEPPLVALGGALADIQPDLMALTSADLVLHPCDDAARCLNAALAKKRGE